MINGPNSRLKTDTIDITGYLIEGKFTQLENINEVELLNVEDETQINIKTETLDMYALSCLLYTSPSPRDRGCSRMPSSA